MIKQAKSAFTVDGREAQPAEWSGGQLSRTRWRKTFTGALAGTSVVEATMLMVDGGPAIYVGIERFECALDGRTGTFILLHSATMRGEERAGSWTIVSGSGTGELASIRGEGEILPNHDFVLRYELD
ncbi:MAG TPA: DUF3224 domain-containing protein [Polyangia bacterium]|nr:DUF3224 domain-containing protein [Polyangia bacterium]